MMKKASYLKSCDNQVKIMWQSSKILLENLADYTKYFIIVYYESR